MARVLIVDDEMTMLQMLSQLLGDLGHEVRAVSTGEKAIEELAEFEPHLILADLRMKGVSGLDVLKAAGPDVPVIIMTAYAEVDTAVEAIRQGASDYLPKPFKLEDLRLKVELALKTPAESSKSRRKFKEPRKAPDMVGQSPVIQELYKTLDKIADTDSTVLITGESGTGKELIARALHNLSSRQKQPFIAINCSALPEPLLESEIFGHKRGSFTGAFADKKGLFEEAEGGSALLDEIGSMPMPLQSKLLRFLQEKELRRVGDNTTRRIDVRVIAATNDNLEEKIRLGSFREDLFYRLSVIPLHLPPLRERLSDVPLLVNHFIKMSAGAMGIAVPAIEPEALRLMQVYPWPGNVRELQNAIERAMAMSDRETIEVRDLPERIRLQETAAQSQPLAIRPLKDVVREFERDYCSKALTLARGDRRAAAHMLKISLPSFYRKLPPSLEDLP
jgi:DNA-binding NtrC family response regulator